MIEFRWLCGWRVLSEMPLPDLLPWTGDDRVPDLEIRIGVVPHRLPNPVHTRPLLQIAADGTCLFVMRGVAAYLIEGGRRVTVAPEMKFDSPDVRVFLLGTVFGILCHQRRLLPLHASSVRIGDTAVAFSGPSGMGKSTLAAAFLRQGHALVSDDITVVDNAAAGGAVVLPAFPRLQLWHDAMAFFALPAAGFEQSRAELQKFHLPVESAFATRPLPLAAVYQLRDAHEPRHERLEPLRGITAVSYTIDDVYRRGMAERLTGARTLLSSVKQLCGTVPVWRLARQRNIDQLDATVAGIIGRHRSAA